MVSSYTISVPCIMGKGAVSTIGEKCSELNIKRAVLVYDKGIEDIGLADKIADYVTDAGVELLRYSGVVPDPTDTSIEEGAKMILENGGVDAVIGLGGGSSLDTAKGINVIMGNGFPLSDYYLGGKPTEKGLPLFLIPTTSGTGSECTYSAIISDTVNNRKTTIRSLNCNLATYAFIDPECTVGMPRSLTIATGLDAFAHAAESLTVNKPNPISEILAKESIRLLTKYLPRAVEDGNDMEAREKVGIAAMISGMAFANTLCHLGHALAHSLGAKLHLVHGYCCGNVLPNAIYYVSDTIPDKVRLIGESMGLTFSDDATSEEIGRRTAEEIIAFGEKLKAPKLSELGVSREDVISVYPLVNKDGCFPFLVKPINDNQIKEMLSCIYDGTLYNEK